MYVIIRSRKSFIMEPIGQELSELSALELENLPYFTFIYTLASANTNQSVPNLATIYMPKRSHMSMIMGQIETEYPELFALEFGKVAESDFVYTLVYKYQPISTKLGQNVCDHKISDELDYGFNRTKNV